MTPRCFKCTQFRKGTLEYSLEGIQLLQNNFFKQRSVTFNATISGHDRIHPNTQLCRTFFTGYIYVLGKKSFMTSEEMSFKDVNQRTNCPVNAHLISWPRISI